MRPNEFPDWFSDSRAQLAFDILLAHVQMCHLEATDKDKAVAQRQLLEAEARLADQIKSGPLFEEDPYGERHEVAAFMLRVFAKTFSDLREVVADADADE